MISWIFKQNIRLDGGGIEYCIQRERTSPKNKWKTGFLWPIKSNAELLPDTFSLNPATMVKGMLRRRGEEERLFPRGPRTVPEASGPHVGIWALITMCANE